MQAQGLLTQGPAADGLVDGAIYIQADEVHQTKDNIIIAQGHVEARYQGRNIQADSLTYDSEHQHTIAEGHASVINPDGSTQFADRLDFYDPEPQALPGPTQGNTSSIPTEKKTGKPTDIIDDRVTTGSARHVASSFADHTKIFANELDRVNADVTTMHQTLYTPCELCVKNNHTEPPVWSIRADTITQDKSKNIVFYQNATIMVHDVPVMYFPFLWHSDPSVKSASGLLMPNFDFSGKRGNSYTQPYLWQISPYQSLLIEPRLNTKVNPFLNLTWNRHFYSGQASVRLGYGHDSFFDNNGHRYTQDAAGNPLPGKGKPNDIGYVLANGAFKINDLWRWEFTGERVFDNGAANLFDRYKVHKTFHEQRGDFTAPSRQLISQIGVTRQSDEVFFNLTSMTFQDLTLDPVNGFQSLNTALQTFRPIAKSSDLQPKVLPRLEATYAPKSKVFGGHVIMSLDGVALARKVYGAFPIAPAAANPAYSFDSVRLTGQVQWRRDMTTKGGLKVSPFFSARHDTYQLNYVPISATNRKTAMASRNLATLGLDMSYPLYQKFNGYAVTITPRAQLAASPRAKTSIFIPNEDSQSFVFDQTTLFKPDRSPGFDLYEGGKRASFGLEGAIRFDSGLNFDTLLGRAFRDQVEDAFLQRVAKFDPTHVSSPLFVSVDQSGLAKKASDWIWDSHFDTGKGFYGYTKINLDGHNSALRHGEAGLSVSKPNTLITLRYVIDRTAPVYGPVASGYQLSRLDGIRDSSTSVYARHFFMKNWGASLRVNKDNLTNQYHASEISLIYRDDCTWLEGVYQYDDSYYTSLNHRKPSGSFTVRINLATFSSNGSDFADIR